MFWLLQGERGVRSGTSRKIDETFFTESVQHELASAKTPTSQRTTRLRTHENATQQTTRRSVEQLWKKTERRKRHHRCTCQHPIMSHIPSRNANTRHSHRVLLRIILDQTDRRTGPERPDMAPTPSRRKQPRHCLQDRARPHDFL
jgi:hypothetical protein